VPGIKEQKMEFTLIPAFIVQALTECLNAGVVPSIRAGQGGNSHSVWFIKFSVRVDREGHMSRYHDFEVMVTSSYSQKFLDFTLFKGQGFDGLTEMRSMASCIAQAKANVPALVS
jgi:hypothetical protein